MIFVFTFVIPECFLHSLPAGFKNTFTIEIYTQIEIANSSTKASLPLDSAILECRRCIQYI